MDSGSFTLDLVAERLNLNRAFIQDLVSRGGVASVPTDNGDLAVLTSKIERYAAIRKEQRLEWLELIAWASEQAGLYDL